MGFFELDVDENYVNRCGELFLTTKGNITIHCTLCELIYKNFESYADHLYKQHSTSFDNLEDSLEVETKVPIDEDDDEDDDEDGEEYNNRIEEENPSISNEEVNPLGEDIKLEILEEIEIQHNTALSEKEMPIEFLKDGQDEVEPEIKEKTNVEKLQRKATSNQMKELTIPKVVRSVKNFAVYGSKVIADEERIHKCPVCSKGFKDRSNMISHLRRHSDDKKYECPKCKKKFYLPSEVRNHMKFHNNDRNFLCSDCGKSFKRNSNLTSHIKRHKNQRDYKCENCGRAFFNSTGLKAHMASHSGERPYACNLCSASFSRVMALRNHMKLHENKREYKCKLCEAAFNQRAGLFSHMKISHKTINE